MLPGDGLQLSLKMQRWEGIDAILHCFTHGRMAQNAANLRRFHILCIHANDMLLFCCPCSGFCQDGLLVEAHRQAGSKTGKQGSRHARASEAESKSRADIYRTQLRYECTLVTVMTVRTSFTVSRWCYLKALHPESAVLHLEQQLLRQDALKLTQRVLMRPQPQLKRLHSN